MAVTLGTVVNATPSGSSRSFDLTGLANGTGCVVVLGGDSAAGAYSAPAGWVEQFTVAGSGTTPKMVVYTRVLNGTEGAAATFVAPGSIGYLIPGAGVDAVNLVDRAAAELKYNTATPTFAGVTTRLPNEVLLLFNNHFVFGSSGTGGPVLSSGPGTAVVAGAVGSYGIAVRSLPVAAPSATGGLTNTWGASGSASAIGAITLRPAGGNIAPAVDVGADSLLTYGDTYQAQATAADPEGAVTYAWTVTTKPSGAAATLSSSTIANPTIKPDKPGTWVLTCVVTDSGGTTATDAVTVTVQAQMWARVAGAWKAGRRRIRKNGAFT